MHLTLELGGEGVDWPAWVQAIGSVVAILAGFAVIILQNYLSDRRDARRRRALARDLAGLLQNTGLRLEEVVEGVEEAASAALKGGDSNKRVTGDILRLVDARLDAFPLHDLEDIKNVALIDGVRTDLHFAQSEVADVLYLCGLPAEEAAEDIHAVLGQLRRRVQRVQMAAAIVHAQVENAPSAIPLTMDTVRNKGETWRL